MKYPSRNQKYLLKKSKSAAYIRNVIRNDHMWAGHYSTCNDEIDAALFEYKNVKYHGNQCPLIIGNFVQCAPGVTFFLDRANHDLYGFTSYRFGPELWKRAGKIQRGPYKGTTLVGNDVWIGYGATIMPGVTISDGAIIGAYSLVTKDIPPYAIVAGNPAKVIRQRFALDVVDALKTWRWWYDSVEDITNVADQLIAGDVNTLVQRAQYAQSLRNKLSGTLSAAALIIMTGHLVDLRHLLASLQRQICSYSQIILVNCLTGGSVYQDKIVARLCESLNSNGCEIKEVLAPDANREAAIARGLRDVTTDIVSLFEDDYIIGEQYLEKILNALKEYPDATVAAGRIVKNRVRGCAYWYAKLFGLSRVDDRFGVTRAGHLVIDDGQGLPQKVRVLGGAITYKVSHLFPDYFLPDLGHTPRWQDSFASSCIEGRRLQVPGAYVYQTRSPFKKKTYYKTHYDALYGYTYFALKKNIDGSKVRLISYYWAVIGMLGYAFAVAIITRNTMRLRASWMGWRQAVRDIRVIK